MLSGAVIFNPLQVVRSRLPDYFAVIEKPFRSDVLLTENKGIPLVEFHQELLQVVQDTLLQLAFGEIAVAGQPRNSATMGFLMNSSLSVCIGAVSVCISWITASLPCAEKTFDFQILLDPFEKEFDLPSLLVNFCD